MKPLGRYELKYWSGEAQLAALLRELEGLLERDPLTSDAAPSYLVTSLYFDTPDRAAFLDKLEGLRRRAKVRLRRYGDEADGVAELKQRVGRRVRKWRTPLPAEELARVARGELDPLLARGEDAGPFLDAFADAALRPAVITRYTREAWRLVHDPGARLTIDRALEGCGRDLAASFLTPDPDPPTFSRLPVAAPAVLEVKVAGPIPRVVGDALRAAGLQRRSISKYCLALAHTDRLPARLTRLGAAFLRNTT